jgi:hypothetical protein
MQVVAVTTDGVLWHWRIINAGTVIAESRLSFPTMDEALDYGYAHAEIMESRTAQNVGSRLCRKPWGPPGSSADSRA